MEKKGFLMKGLPFLLFLTVVIWGCQTTPVPVQHLSCEEQLRQSIDRLSPSEIRDFLDEAHESGKIETCWSPMIKKCLDGRKEIPHKHLKLAIKAFNQNQYQNYFNKAVYRYFNSIIFSKAGKGIRYRKQDKDFLTAYISYTLRHCTSKECPPLKNAKQICNRLDPDLHTKFFE